MIPSVSSSNFQDSGYILIRDVVPCKAIDQLLENFLRLVHQLTGVRFEDAQSPEIATYLKEHKDIQGRVYDEIRRPPWLTEFSQMTNIIEPVKRLLGPDIALMRKIPFRIDVPLDTVEFAAWHQDYYYVRGNLDIVTAWIPMQDTPYLNGCLAVMPGSHKLGPLEHDMVVVRKRHCPSNIFDREIRYVEMRRGDMLLFHSCLLHSSNLNFSDALRCSVQPRYTRAAESTDPGMGGIVLVQP